MKKLLLAVFLFGFFSISKNSSGQDYLITFAGTGAATTVSTVEVENLATGKTITLNGGDILHLTSVVGISQPENKNSSEMRIYPNPMMDNSILALQPPKAGDAVITVYEITGKTVAQIHTYLENSSQEFRLSGLKNGLYLINARGNSYQYYGKILSTSQADGVPRMEKVTSTAESKIEKISKKEFRLTQGTVDMDYTAGERLKFKAISGIYSTVKTDIPIEDKTLSFIFIPCTDGDNNNYPLVEIGAQIWMAENLKTTKYNDGTEITYGTEWNQLITSNPYYCYYGNDSATYYTVYGSLYNWLTVNTGKLCPSGWHVPSDEEWTVLYDYLGADSIAGGKLKETGKTHWLEPNEEATNETGFTSLPGGYINTDPTFQDVGLKGSWWSSTSGTPMGPYGNSARSLEMLYSFGGMNRSYKSKLDGLSVRCVNDSVKTVLSTADVIEITTTSAVSGGEITDNWGISITDRGVCLSTHRNPTFFDGSVTSSSELDSFTCLITGLTINTKYYVRAYATNCMGTGYGNEIMFATKGETGTLSDIDGNNYSTIEIGSQTWMAENLKTTKYNDGTPIPLVKDSVDWFALVTPGYCWYNNDSATYYATYGALYNSYAAHTEKLCPLGWHVFSDEEWAVLTDYLGGEGVAGGKLKEAGLAHWIEPNQNATNESGFSALPGGCRGDGGFGSIGYYGNWWSTSHVADDGIPAPFLLYDSGIVQDIHLRTHYQYGYSVRCLKDE